ncbi:MAG TPA: hypothetical protein VES42_12840 [Pilimelia sp.]|nr:hypothetical protein [Pilimelia sp.]
MREREVDGDVETATRPWAGGERGVVCVGDGGDDGEAEAVSVRLVGAVGGDALEGLE